MEDKPLVSVCIPVYNCEAYIADAVNSALSQTYKNIEVICVDDGSRDQSLAVLGRFSDRITVISTENQGAPAARNRALAEAKGEVIQFLDGDNILDVDKVERQLPYLLEGYDLVFGRKRVLTEDGSLEELSSLPDIDGGDGFKYCLTYNLPGGRAAIDTEAPLHRRHLVDKIGGFRVGVKRGQDKDLVFRLTAAGAKIKYLDGVFNTYRNHGGERISNTKKDSGFHVRYFLSLAKELLRGRIYDMDHHHRVMLSLVIYRYAKLAARNGALDDAEEGVRMSRSLGFVRDSEESLFYQLLRSLFGIGGAERVRSVLMAFSPQRNRQW